jgi:CheY-like chemotaxis protein
MGLKGKNFLLIDDDELILNLLKKILIGTGGNVFLAVTVKEAKLILVDIHPDVIVLDLNMPEEDGFSFLEYRNNDPNLKKVPVLVFSVEEREQTIVKAIKLKANDYLLKPLINTIFLQKVRKLVLSKNEDASYDDFVALPFELSSRFDMDIELAKISSKSLVLKGPVKFYEKGINLLICPECISDMERKDFVCRTVDISHSAYERGVYTTLCQIVGLNDQQADKIRNRVIGKLR